MSVLLYSQMKREKGGAQTVFENIANGLKKKGHKVDCLYYNTELNGGRYIRSRKGYEINLFMPPRLKSFLHPKYFFRFLASLIGLYIFLYKTQPTVVNYHFYRGSSFFFVLLKKIFGYRLVISCHGSDVTNIKGMHYRLAPFILKNTDLVVGVSKKLLQILEEKFPKNYDTEVIPNAIDLGFWETDKNKSNNKTKKLTIVSVGTLRAVKGHDILIEAFEKVIKFYPEISLHIIGDGPNKELYQSIIKNKFSDVVYLKGWLSSKEVRKELRKASMFVFPSRREGFGIALLEAMATGLPIIASKTGGIPEVLQQTDSILVTPGNPSHLAEAILKGIEDESWRCKAGKKSRMRARNFSWEKTLNNYEQALFSNYPI